ncbi:UNKNOWN [Stylonychia lemnae]|uniref:Uncharacterized protein n=1 Tax=Stylonychia lemnae TaxID=5949 RepID=A0A078BBM4_STYLE|nr:UNKNOWN [Stylonychia lemnae]|eukprot:CDW90968.1 UNKNOWN [Stylonychia lemnae]
MYKFKSLDAKDFQISKCPAGRFLGENVQTDDFNVEQNYFCLVPFQTALQGSFSTKEAKYIQIYVGGCNQAILNKTKPNLKCANQTDIKKALDSIEFNLIASNQFVDVNE